MPDSRHTGMGGNKPCMNCKNGRLIWKEPKIVFGYDGLRRIKAVLRGAV